jgi:hypothetical protein
MKNMFKYFKKPHRVIGIFTYLFSGFGTVCMVMYAEIPEWLKAVVFITYIALVLSAIVFVSKWSSLAVYMDIVERLFVRKGIAIQQDDNIENYIRLCKERGIDDIKEEANYTEIINHISGAKNSIKIVMYYGAGFFHQAKGAINEAIGNSVTVQVIIARGKSELLNEVWELENGEKQKLWDSTYTYLDETVKKTSPGRLFNYHQCNTQIRYALILVDSKWAWWTPYHPGIDVPDTASFVLVNKGDNSIIKH